MAEPSTIPTASDPGTVSTLRLAGRLTALCAAVAVLLVWPWIRESEAPTWVYEHGFASGACLAELWSVDADGEPVAVDPDELLDHVPAKTRDALDYVRSNEHHTYTRALCQGTKASPDHDDVHLVLRCRTRDALMVRDRGERDVCNTHRDPSHRGRELVIPPPPPRPKAKPKRPRKDPKAYEPVKNRNPGSRRP